MDVVAVIADRVVGKERGTSEGMGGVASPAPDRPLADGRPSD
jgi:hypothetical protein